MNDVFNRQLAVRFGIREALVLHELRGQWMMREALHFPRYGGRTWCRISAGLLAARLPELNERAARRILRRLVSLGILDRSEQNEHRFDRTASYTFTDYGRRLLREAYGR